MMNIDPGKVANKEFIPFVLQYSRRNVEAARILKQEYETLQTKLRLPFNLRPIIAYSKNRSLHDLLPFLCSLIKHAVFDIPTENGTTMEEQSEEYLFTVELKTYSNVGGASKPMMVTVPNVASLTLKCRQCEMSFDKQFSSQYIASLPLHKCGSTTTAGKRDPEFDSNGSGKEGQPQSVSGPTGFPVKRCIILKKESMLMKRGQNVKLAESKKKSLNVERYWKRATVDALYKAAQNKDKHLMTTPSVILGKSPVSQNTSQIVCSDTDAADTSQSAEPDSVSVDTSQIVDSETVPVGTVQSVEPDAVSVDTLQSFEPGTLSTDTLQSVEPDTVSIDTSESFEPDTFAIGLGSTCISGTSSALLESCEPATPELSPQYVEGRQSDDDYTSNNSGQVLCTADEKFMKYDHLYSRWKPEKANKCPICAGIFRSKQHLTRHIRFTHTTERPFKCVSCGKCFQRKAALNAHMVVHGDAEKRFLCDICGKKFLRNRNRLLHMRRHNKCPKCDKSFERKAHLRLHMRRHTGEKEDLCTKCGQRFSNAESLHRHLICHEIKENPNKCLSCDKQYIDHDELRLHECPRGKNNMCTICGKNCSSGAALQRHMQAHMRLKQRICEFCKEKFPNKLESQIHLDENILKCTDCRKTIQKMRKCMLNKMSDDGLSGLQFRCWSCHSNQVQETQL